MHSMYVQGREGGLVAGAYVLETPLGLRKVAGTNVTGDFSGFENASEP